MSKFRSTAAASTTLLVTSLVPAFGAAAVATESSLELTPEETQACIAPLASRNPDVLQGWIDNCRRDRVVWTAALLGNKI